MHCSTYTPFLPLWTLVGAAASQHDYLIDLGYATYNGSRNDTSGITAWYGIRYAKPPVGELRWRQPIRVDSHGDGEIAPHETSIDATTRGPSCLQITPSWSPNTASEEGQSEDCLLLDVLAPTHRPCSKLPVLVRIHGGGYTTGNNEPDSGDAIVHHAREGLIFVAIQYRLGPLGFLGGHAVKEDGVANVGLLDQRLALQWIQDNIVHFGGDPDKITISGGSAGAGSVALQMTMFGGVDDPPFRAAIQDFPWWTPMRNDAWLFRQYNRLLESSDCSSLHCLRSLPLLSIREATTASALEAYEEGEYGFGNFYWGPYADGNIIRNSLSVDFASGHFTRIPIMVNHSPYEGVLFSDFLSNTSTDLRQEIQSLFPAGNPAYIEQVMDAYSSVNTTALKDGSAFLQSIDAAFLTVGEVLLKRQDIFGNLYVNCATTQIVKAAHAEGLNAYKMIFDAGYQLHGAISSYVYSKDLSPSGEIYLGDIHFPGNSTLATFIRDYIVNFVASLDPNLGQGEQSRPIWSAYDSEGREVIVIRPDEMTTIYDTDINPRCRILDIGSAFTEI